MYLVYTLSSKYLKGCSTLDGTVVCSIDCTLTVLSFLVAMPNDHTLFIKCQHSSNLVTLLNSFARTECDLPPCWENKEEP